MIVPRIREQFRLSVVQNAVVSGEVPANVDSSVVMLKGMLKEGGKHRLQSGQFAGLWVEHAEGVSAVREEAPGKVARWGIEFVNAKTHG